MPELVQRAEAGGEVVLTKHGRAAVQNFPAKHPPSTAERHRLISRPRASAANKVRAEGRVRREAKTSFMTILGRRNDHCRYITALMAIQLGENQADRCALALEQADDILISPATLAETLIVSASQRVQEELEELVNGLDFCVEPESNGSAIAAAYAHSIWNKRNHPEKLNFADCFAYALAQHKCPRYST